MIRLRFFSLAPLFSVILFFSCNAVLAKATVSTSAYEAMTAAFPDMKSADDEMRAAYRQARDAIGEEGGGGPWLGHDQMIWESVRTSLAADRGDVGSPAFVERYTALTRQRTQDLRTIIAEGRVLERQIYDRSTKPDGYLQIWKYEKGKASADLGTFFDEKGSSSVRCTLRYTTTRNANGTWSSQMPDFSDAAVAIAPGVVDDSEGFDAHVTKQDAIDCLFHTAKGDKTAPPFDASDFRSMRIIIASDDGEHYTTVATENAAAYRAKAIVPLEGSFRRTNKVPRADDPTLEEIAACTLGQDRSQTVRLMRNRDEYDRAVYYFKTAQGLFAFSSFGIPEEYGSYDEVEDSRNSSALSFMCDGDKKEKVMVVAGEFTGNSIHVRVIRYNSIRKEWQILNTGERMAPDWIYLNDKEMKVIVPHPFDPDFTVYRIGKKKTDTEQEKVPPSKGYRVVPVTTNILEETDD